MTGTAEIRTERVASFDGVELAVHHAGDESARPLLLLHGLFSDANTNWIKFGHAAQLAEAGFHCIMADARAHGESAAPHDPQAYPTDVLLDDVRHLIEHFKLTDYDLAGFSLGARTSAKLLSEGLRPRRAILAGMGLEGLTDWSRRRQFFLDVIAKTDTAKRGDPHWMAIQFMKTMNVDPVAAKLLLESFGGAIDTDFSSIDLPVLVLCGRDDRDNGDPAELAERFPDASLVEIEGTHMSCVTKPELGREMVNFLQH